MTNDEEFPSIFYYLYELYLSSITYSMLLIINFHRVIANHYLIDIELYGKKKQLGFVNNLVQHF